MKEGYSNELAQRIYLREYTGSLSSIKESEKIQTTVLMGEANEGDGTILATTLETKIPPFCTVIETQGKELSLVGRWREEGVDLNLIFQAESSLYRKDRHHLLVTFTNSPFNINLLLAQDERIFYDLALSDKEILNPHHQYLERCIQAMQSEFGIGNPVLPYANIHS